MLYLIKSGKYSKIGYTADFNQRYREYLTCNPNIEVLGLREGDEYLENVYHKIFYNRNYYNEWFDIPQYILDYLVTHQFIIKFENDKKNKLKYKDISNPQIKISELVRENWELKEENGKLLQKIEQLGIESKFDTIEDFSKDLKDYLRYLQLINPEWGLTLQDPKIFDSMFKFSINKSQKIIDSLTSRGRMKQFEITCDGIIYKITAICLGKEDTPFKFKINS